MAEEVIEFSKCPACGSEERYCESLANQEKARGHMRKDLRYCFEVVNKVCMDDQMVNNLPVGTEMPAYTATTDICSNCGNIYVTSITEVKATKQPQLLVPGGKGFIPPQFPGPGMSNPKAN